MLLAWGQDWTLPSGLLILRYMNYELYICSSKKNYQRRKENFLNDSSEPHEAGTRSLTPTHRNNSTKAIIPTQKCDGTKINM